MRITASADLIDDREYAAPPDLVFEAWTKAEHFARWFALDDVEVPLCEIDARPGGVIRFDRPTVNAMMPEWPVGAHIVMTVELVATARGTRMTVAQRVAEPELADSAPIVRHRKLAAIGWSQTAERLVAYLERRTPWDS